MIFIDSNVPMYRVGGPHKHKDDAQRVLDLAITRGERLVSSAEVLQEILHRYSSIGRLEAIQPAFDMLLTVVDDMLSVDLEAIQIAKRIVMGRLGLSARDAVHLAVMEQAGIRRIMSFDAGFDAYPGVQRLS